MRYLITTSRGTPGSPDQVPSMLWGIREWRQRHRNRMDGFWFYEAGGGCGIVNVEDPAEVDEIVTSWPLAPHSRLSVHPLVDGDETLEQMEQQLESVFRRPESLRRRYS